MDETLITLYAGRSLEDVPEEARQQIEADPRMLEAFRAQHDVARLMSLKRYEIPDSAMEGRLVHRVGIRIRNGEVRPRGAPWRGVVLPEWARMMSVVVVMLVLSVWTHREMLNSNQRELNGFPVEDLVAEGRNLSVGGASPGILVSDLIQEDAFTTRLPTFDLAFDAFRFPELGAGLEPIHATPVAVSTNRWASPLMVPVRYPAP